MSDHHELMRQIEQQLVSIPDFGQLQIHVKKHLGEFSNTDIVKMTSYRYTDNEPNVTCTTNIYSLIKNVTDANLTGTLSFTVSFKKGRADLMQVQDFKRL